MLTIQPDNGRRSERMKTATELHEYVTQGYREVIEEL